jgi:hypothetical protein
MRRTRTLANVIEVKRRKPRRKDAVYNQVFDEKRLRARGLWEKRHRYFAQLDANHGNQYRYLLQDAKTVPEAETARQVLKDLQHQGKFVPARQGARASGKAQASQNGQVVKNPTRTLHSAVQLTGTMMMWTSCRPIMLPILLRCLTPL